MSNDPINKMVDCGILVVIGIGIFLIGLWVGIGIGKLNV
jgi:hypothetical protein